MISESLRRLGDLLAGHILNGQPPTMDQLSAMSLELLDHARVVAVMETLPFDVTPEGQLARISRTE